MKTIHLIFFLLYLGFQNVLPQESCLLIVDVQPLFYENTDMEEQANEMIRHINYVISKVEPQKVVYIKATGKALSISRKGIKVLPALPAPELDNGLNMVSGNIFTKVTGDALKLKDLNRFLTLKKTKEVIIVGLVAEKCVYSTALGARAKGYDVTLVSEAVLSSSQEKKEQTFKKLTKKGIKIVSVKDL